MIKAILIDVDDTLLDFHAYVKWAMAEGFKKYELGEFNEEVYAVFQSINVKMWEDLEKGILTYEELLKTRWNTVFAALGIDFDGVEFEKFFKGALYNSAIPVDGAEDILGYLSGKYMLCAASNGPLGQQINRIRIADMEKYFAHIFISEGVGAQKPSKEFFDYCMARMEGIAADEVMVIGDSLTSDMKGAIDYGMHTCFFDRKGAGTKGMSIEHTVRTLAEIKNIL